MITTLTADKCNTIKAEGSVVICQSERGRHVRVINGLNEEPVGWQGWILYVNFILPLFLSLAVGVWLKEHSGVSVYLFCQALSLLSQRRKIPKPPLRLILKTTYNLYESVKKQDNTHPTKIFSIQRQGDRQMKREDMKHKEKNVCLFVNKD